MKNIVVILLFSFFVLNVYAQEVTHVEWVYKIKKKSSSEYELYMLAIIEKPWHLYGQYFEDGGPIKLKFNFVENSNYYLVDSVLESPKPHIVRDDIFDIDIQYFTNRVFFTQKVKVNKPTEIKMILEGQICDDNTGMCVVVEDEHIFKLKK